ncbi:MAG: DUF4199 domain-containing protein [Lewinellaceae bacterium]|nr:DUF4199 domain-containing protein [Saprospiraceae bacterium]MCB9339822.1 DUF4199 domain-containing protein [Lewinellaceae bacterium]
MAGAAMVLYLLLFYYFDRANILNPLVFWSTLIIAGTAMITAVKSKRSDNGGKITRQDALKTAFLVFVISMLVFHLFSYVMFNFVDPGLTDLQKQMMEAAGRETKDLDFKMTFGRVMFGYAFSLIGGFFISYLIASILKK